jgi:hypothetical protein
MKRFLIIAMAGLTAGCSSSEIAQRNLIDQLDRGIQNVQQGAADRQQLLDALYAQQRHHLDAAFDADVLASKSRDAQWMIEHRQAYTLALESIWQQQLASQSAHARTAENLQTIHEGLLKLRWMSELRQKWSDMATQAEKEVGNGQH